MRISDWSSDVCSSDLPPHGRSSRAEAQSWPVLVRPRPGSSTGAVVSSANSRSDRRSSSRMWSRKGRRYQAARPTQSAKVDRSSRMRSEEHTSELQSLMRISYAVFCLKKNNTNNEYQHNDTTSHAPTRQNQQ